MHIQGFLNFSESHCKTNRNCKNWRITCLINIREIYFVRKILYRGGLEGIATRSSIKNFIGRRILLHISKNMSLRQKFWWTYYLPAMIIVGNAVSNKRHTLAHLSPKYEKFQHFQYLKSISLRDTDSV